MAMNRTPIEDTARRPPRPQQRGSLDPTASELKSMTNGYQIDSYAAFPFIWRRRHPPTNSQYAFKAAVLSSADANDQEYTMSVQQPVLTAPHGGETVTSSGGSSVEMKVESSQSGGDYGVVLWTLRAGEEPPLHTHSREDELLYVVQGQLIARVGDARVEVGPGAYAALPRGVPHAIEVVGDQATLLLSFVPGGLERFLVPRDGERPDPAAFGLTFP
jgi:quercetin dioxygenase-like cupin family protein